MLAPSTEGGVPLFIVMNAWVNPVDFIFPEFLDWSDWSEILTTVEPNLAKGGGRYHVGTRHRALARSVTVFAGVS